MDIQHTGRNFELTDAIRSYAEDKLTKACSQLERFSAAHMHITYEHEGHGKHGNNRVIHVVVSVPHSEVLTVREVNDDLYAAIDLAAKHLERQVVRYRNKHNAHERARGSRPPDVRED